MISRWGQQAEIKAINFQDLSSASTEIPWQSVAVRAVWSGKTFFISSRFSTSQQSDRGDR
jgi:hypothetical protein